MAQKMAELGGENLGVMGPTVDEMTGHSVEFVNNQVGLKNPHQYAVQFNDSNRPRPSFSIDPNEIIGTDDEAELPIAPRKKFQSVPAGLGMARAEAQVQNQTRKKKGKFPSNKMQ